MDVMFERVAGLDIDKKSVTVCVRTPWPGGGRHGETHAFRIMTGPLELMRDWLVGQRVTLAATESTSTYWKPVFHAWEETDGGLAAQRRPHGGRRGPQDGKDSEWIAQLLEHGLLRPSFVPLSRVRQLRLLVDKLERLGHTVVIDPRLIRRTPICPERHPPGGAHALVGLFTCL